MEDEKSYSDICGGRLALRRRYYSPYCREFGLSSARLSLRSLTAVTCAVWLAAYGLFTLCEVKAGADPWTRAGGWGFPGSGTPSRGRTVCPKKFVLLGVLPQWVAALRTPRASLLGELSVRAPPPSSVPVIASLVQNSRKVLLPARLCTCVYGRSALFLPHLCVSKPCKLPPLSQSSPDLSALSKELPDLKHGLFPVLGFWTF